MPPEERDESIILAIKNGDEASFKILIDKYTPSIFNFANRFVGRDRATDVTQEIFIKVWKNISKFDDTKASFKTWLFTIAKNTTTDFLRKRKEYVFSDIDGSGQTEEENFSEKIPDEALLPDEAMSKIQNKEFLEKIIEELRPSYREILMLHYQEEMTFDEIGKVLGKPLNTVKSQHQRAILELRKIISTEQI
ncbi:RNA polymerase sigma factor [Patescibacteria group bacterium]|nr:RNA polymerase sigma factor [Patescibacteria group bacterium]